MAARVYGPEKEPSAWIRLMGLAHADPPSVRFHDLRHGAASLAKAPRLDSKYFSALLGQALRCP